MAKVVRGFPCALCGKKAGETGYGANNWLKCNICGYTVCSDCQSIHKKTCPICKQNNKSNTMVLIDG